MKTILLAILSLSLYAQTVISQTGPATVRPGQTLTINLQAQGGSDTGAAAFQWTINVPNGYTVTTQPTAGAASTASSKTIYCGTGNLTCLAVGFSGNTGNNTVIPNGVLATYAVKVPANASPGTVSFSLSGLVGAAPDASAIAVNSGPAYTVTVLDKLDLNGDGKVDISDVQLMLTEVIASFSNPAACVDDVNGDGACNLLDVEAVLVKAIGQ